MVRGEIRDGVLIRRILNAGGKQGKTLEKSDDSSIEMIRSGSDSDGSDEESNGDNSENENSSSDESNSSENDDTDC